MSPLTSKQQLTMVNNKKKNRKNTPKEKPGMTYNFKHGCRHGAPDDLGVAQQLLILQRYLVFRNEVGSQFGVTVYLTSSKKPWLMQKRGSGVILSTPIRGWGHGQTSPSNGGRWSLTGNSEEMLARARQYHQQAMFHRARIDHSATQHKWELLKFVGREVYDARTEHGTKLQMAECVTCACLDKIKATENSEERTRMCDYCKAEGTRQTIKKCSGCGVASYCSKECQRLARAGHKAQCIPSSAANLFKKKKWKNVCWFPWSKGPW